jgi:ParB family chromosome partitioning protein
VTNATGTKGPEKLLESLSEVPVLALPCHLLADHPLRQGFYNQAHLAELTVSIKEAGLVEPLVVRPRPANRYQVLSGHCRLRAVRRLRWTTVPCRVWQGDDRTALVIYCTVNVFNRGLSAIEEGHLLAALCRDGGFTLEQAAGLWGRSKSWASRRIKLLYALDPRIKGELAAGMIGPRLAIELARLPRGNDQERVLTIVRKQGLNKNEVAALVQRWKSVTEEERTMLTDGGELPDRTLNDPRGGQAHLQECLKRCLAALEELTMLLAEGEIPVNQWPSDQYHAFVQAVRTVNQFIQ